MRTLLALLLVPACAADSYTTATQRVDGRPEDRTEVLLCDKNLCVLHDETDSDGDGVADADEEVLATDPRDPLRYPTVADLAALMPTSALPSFAVGNSMLVVLPTRDANGTPVFGGEAALPSRRSALERAGISVPSGIDLGAGFSMARTLRDASPSFNGLFWANARGRDGGVARQVGKALDSFGDHLSDIEGERTVDGEIEFGKFHAYDDRRGGVTVHYENGPNGYWHTDTKSDDGNYHSETRHTQDDAGNSYEETTTTWHDEDERSLGTVTTDTTTTTSTATSHDGGTTFSTTTTTTTTTYPNGKTTKSETTTTKSCSGDECTTTTDGNSSDPESPAGEPTEEGSSTAYRNPEHDIGVGVSPEVVHMVLAKLGSNVNVSSDANGPLVHYEYSPEGVGNKWGPISLITGDDTGVTTPGVLHIPSATPDYDPQLQHDLPPPELPSDGTCLYCFQQ